VFMCLYMFICSDVPFKKKKTDTQPLLLGSGSCTLRSTGVYGSPLGNSQSGGQTQVRFLESGHTDVHRAGKACLGMLCVREPPSLCP
jgi:hypothetical protein